MPNSRGRRPKQQGQQPLQNHHYPKKEKLCHILVKRLSEILGQIIGAVWGCIRPYLRPRRLLRLCISVLAVGASALFFLPRVTVEPSGPYSPSQPTPLIFTISNVNIVPLRNVQVGIGVCYFDLGTTKIRSEESGNEQTPTDCNGPSKGKINITGWFYKWLGVDEKAQIPIESGIKNGLDLRQQIDHANITIAITYTPWLMPGFWRYTREFRFVTQKLSDGKTYWTPVPLNK